MRILMHGAQELSDVDLLAVVLGSAGLARALARTYVTWWELAAGEIRATPRFSPARTAQVLALVELSRRIGVRPLQRGASLGCSEDVATAYGQRLRHQSQEVFIVVALDARNRVISEHEIARGTLTSVGVHPRDVFRPLIRQSAASMIGIHNHPSGDPSPSSDDHSLCERLCRAGRLLGIPVLDFIIVGGDDHVSFADRAWVTS
ncbi:MAG: DNA repair protein RadC [Myxococcales bacterium]|nr:DNA repair protein RadC [Myxococcales bacterium]